MSSDFFRWAFIKSTQFNFLLIEQIFAKFYFYSSGSLL